MHTTTVTRVAPGTGSWRVSLDGTHIGWVRGAKELGFEWGASNGCHGITRLPTLGDATEALVEHIQTHVAPAVA